MTCFVKDSLDQIFLKVSQKQPKILQSLALSGDKSFIGSNQNDPFKLYQGYIEIVRPIEYETDLADYKKEILCL